MLTCIELNAILIYHWQVVFPIFLLYVVQCQWLWATLAAEAMRNPYLNASTWNGESHLYARRTDSELECYAIIQQVRHNLYSSYTKNNQVKLTLKLMVFGWRKLIVETPMVKVKTYSVHSLVPPRCSHDLPSRAGMYTRRPSQSTEGYSRASRYAHCRNAMNWSYLCSYFNFIWFIFRVKILHIASLI